MLVQAALDVADYLSEEARGPRHYGGGVEKATAHRAGTSKSEAQLAQVGAIHPLGEARQGGLADTGAGRQLIDAGRGGETDIVQDGLGNLRRVAAQLVAAAADEKEDVHVRPTAPSRG
ncbi:hypothetical protein D3C78_1597030 [compost metagenome]